MKVTTLDHVHIYARDVQTTLDFYTRCLGAEPVGAISAGDGREHQFVMLGGQTIAVSPFPETMQAADPPAVGDGAVSCGFGVAHFGINVEDIEAAVTHLRRQGVAVHGEIASAGALRYVYFSAPDGVVIELTQYVVARHLAPAAKLLGAFNRGIHAMRRGISKRLLSAL